jgi:hypothetical protein
MQFDYLTRKIVPADTQKGLAFPSEESMTVRVRGV